jgi:hypothetical protein
VVLAYNSLYMGEQWTSVGVFRARPWARAMDEQRELVWADI